MKVSTKLPGSKIIIHTNFTAVKGSELPVGLMLSVRSLTLSLNKKHIRLLAIVNKKVIEKLYGGISEEAYKQWGAGKFYDFYKEELQAFIDSDCFTNADELYGILTKN